MFLTNRYLFWTDWGLSRIERSYFDGSGRSTLISNVRWPNGLTIDYEEERLYWTDANTGSIESANIHGGDRRVILNQLNSTFGITLVRKIIVQTKEWNFLKKFWKMHDTDAVRIKLPVSMRMCPKE